jgi:hypothetical protein
MLEKGRPLIIPALATALGAYWLYYSLMEYSFYDRSGPLTGFFPAIVAVMMIVISLALLATGSEAEKSDFRPLQLLPTLGALLIAVLGQLFGTMPALFIFMLAWLRGFERYNLKFSLTISGVVTLVLWLVFDMAVSVYFQPGAIREWLQG